MKVDQTILRDLSDEAVKYVSSLCTPIHPRDMKVGDTVQFYSPYSGPRLGMMACFVVEVDTTGEHPRTVLRRPFIGILTGEPQYEEIIAYHYSEGTCWALIGPHASETMQQALQLTTPVRPTV